jgi:hypothetical protein
MQPSMSMHQPVENSFPPAQYNMQPPAYSSHTSYGAMPPQAPVTSNYANSGRAIVKDDPHVGPIVPISAINPYSSK